MSHCISPLQSFLVVRDPATSQPSLLCVSAGGEPEGVLDYHIKTTSTGMENIRTRLPFHLILIWLGWMHSDPTGPCDWAQQKPQCRIETLLFATLPLNATQKDLKYSVTVRVSSLLRLFSHQSNLTTAAHSFLIVLFQLCVCYCASLKMEILL